MKHILTVRELKAFFESIEEEDLDRCVGLTFTMLNESDEEEEMDLNAHCVKWTIDWSGVKMLTIISN